MSLTKFDLSYSSRSISFSLSFERQEDVYLGSINYGDYGKFSFREEEISWTATEVCQLQELMQELGVQNWWHYNRRVVLDGASWSLEFDDKSYEGNAEVGEGKLAEFLTQMFLRFNLPVPRFERELQVFHSDYGHIANYLGYLYVIDDIQQLSSNLADDLDKFAALHPEVRTELQTLKQEHESWHFYKGLKLSKEQLLATLLWIREQSEIEAAIESKVVFELVDALEKALIG